MHVAQTDSELIPRWCKYSSITLITEHGTVGMNPFTQVQMYNFGALTKLLIILCMFLGQLGISNTLLAFIKPSKKTNYKYLEEDVTIG
nr:hypothetical protein [Entomoplasma sp. MP1]